MGTEGEWSFWPVVLAAHEAGAHTVRFTDGRAPTMRLADGSLAPVPDYDFEITHAAIMRELSVLVEPERWDAIEEVGEGQVALPPMIGRTVKMTVFSSLGKWVAVVYL